MKPAPIFEALDSLCDVSLEKPHVVFFTPTGTPFTQTVAERLSKKPRIIFMCGRYEGMDQRAYSLADEELSLGDYVLTGGELACMVVVDAIVRLLPGALGDEASAQDESFSDGLLEYEQYTRPSSYRGLDVPDVLLSGDHGKIAAWRRANALERTVLRRPDLLEHATLSKEEQLFAQQVLDAQIKENEKSDESRHYR